MRKLIAKLIIWILNDRAEWYERRLELHFRDLESDNQIRREYKEMFFDECEVKVGKAMDAIINHRHDDTGKVVIPKEYLKVVGENGTVTYREVI